MNEIQVGEDVKIRIPGLAMMLPGTYRVTTTGLTTIVLSPNEDVPGRRDWPVTAHVVNVFRVCDYCDNGVDLTTNVCRGCGYDFTDSYNEDGEI